MEYIATFHTHFAAQAFARRLTKESVEARMMPVPRSLSASCGTCVAFSYAGDFHPLLVQDTQGVYAVENGAYTPEFIDEDDL
ncbi:MAG: DUF3343 domain-containing protein [Clostridia bacterium]|nr:DUF3343 domain-containing protein [Clostridia bacterium]